MKIFFAITLATLSYLSTYAQVSSYGLEGKSVTNIREFNKVLHASTIDNGIFRRAPSDTGWILMGLEGKNILTVYPHKPDAAGFTITAGIKPNLATGDSTFIYGYSGGDWKASDSGIIKPYLEVIYVINGCVTKSGAQIKFALGNFREYRMTSTEWDSIGDYGGEGFALEISPQNIIWMSLQTKWGVFNPLLGKSTDLGDTWEFVDWSSVMNMSYVFSLALHPTDKNIIYGGDFWCIWKTIDEGVTWDTIICSDCRITAIALNPFNSDQLFAGTYCGSYGDSAKLFETSDGGTIWQEILLPDGLKGIKDLEIGFRDSLELYIATEGTGIYRLTRPTDVFSIEVDSGWNMISVPNIISDYSKNSLFPNAISDAFIYRGSYTQKDTLENGGGYWIKFKDSGFHYFTGEEINTDTIIVHAGWNIIGSISKPVKTSDIITDPPGIVTEWHFYGYDGDYFEIQTIEPGYAYWVKVNQVGKLILIR